MAVTAVGMVAQTPDTVVSEWQAGMRAGYAFNSNPVLMDRMEPDGKVTHTALSWHLRYAFRRLSVPRYTSVYQGIGLSVNTFMQPREVGTPIGLYVLQGAPVAVLAQRLSLDYEWNFGAAFGWHKSGQGTAIRSNLVVGSSVNAYLNLGLKLNYTLCDALRLSGGLDLTHYSNGNTSWPNPGVNLVGAAIGVSYIPGRRFEVPRSPFVGDDDFRQCISVDVTAYCAWRKAYFPPEDGAFTEYGEQALLPGRFGVAGVSVAPMWDVHPAFRTGLSADVQWSENTGLTQYHVPGTSGDDIKFYQPPFFKQVSAGLSARAELVMPVFALNIGIGYGLLGPHETRKLYQTVNLKAYPGRIVYLNIGYRLQEFHSPSNLMVGFGATLGRRR